MTRRVVRRPAAQDWMCSCGATTVTPSPEKIIVRGKGWRKEYQWIVCGKCGDLYRFSPDVIWETASGARYNTRNYAHDAKSTENA